MMIDIKKLRKLAKAATKGAWIHQGVNVRCDITELHRERYYKYNRIIAGTTIHDNRSNDMAYIAAANPSTILPLLDHIEQIEAEIARLRKDAEKELTVPRNAEEMLAFIGGNYNQMQYGDESGDYEDKTRIRYTLTIHDLLSCFEWWDFHNPLLADHHSGDVNEMIKPDTSTQEVG